MTIYHNADNSDKVKSGGNCFSKSQTILVGEEKILMSDILPEMRTLAIADENNLGVCETQILTFFHYDENAEESFLCVETVENHQIELTCDHLIFSKLNLDSPKWLPAKKLTTDHMLLHFDRGMFVWEKIKQTSLIRRYDGVYAPFSDEGTLIVNDFVVSCYAPVIEWCSHDLADLAMEPLKAYYKIMANKKNKIKGIHPYLSFLYGSGKLFKVI